MMRDGSDLSRVVGKSIELGVECSSGSGLKQAKKGAS